MNEAALAPLRRHHRVHYDPTLADRQQDLPELLAETQALIVRNRTRVTAPLLEAAPHLTCIGRLGVGLDNLDLHACSERGVAVFPATGANDQSVAEYVIGTAMLLLRGAYRVNQRMIAGDWPRTQCSGREISGKSIGLIGFGSIGQKTARLATALGMRPLAYDPYLPQSAPAWSGVSRLELSELLVVADIVSIHVPLTDATRHLIGETELATMKPDAVLINSSRGAVVDENALAVALRAGHPAGAALDVFGSEPLNAAAGELFRGIENLILTPHIAGVTAESNQRVSELIADRVMAHLAKTAERE